MNDTTPRKDPPRSPVLRADGPSEVRRPSREWVGCPDDLLANATLHALDVKLEHRALFKTWTKFRRTLRSTKPLSMPEVTHVAKGIARVRLSAGDASGNHLQIRLPAMDGERFLGFGERFNAVDQRGQALEVWTEEGAIGLGERLSRLLTWLGVSWNPIPKGPTTSYKPFPWMISSRGYAIYLETTCPVFCDVAKTDDRTVAFEIAAREVDLVIFYDAAPKELVQSFATYTGRTRGVPDWALGPWNDAIFGEEEVRRIAALLRKEKIPSSALWAEDWQNGSWSFFGDTRWSFYNINPVGRDVDRSRYPHFESLARDLHGSGFKLLGYCFPYVPVGDPDFEEASAKKLFLVNGAGEPALVQIFTTRCAQLDLTNPAARAWHKEELSHAVRVGFDGWMADFGEYTPIDSRTHDGKGGLEHHNAFPLLWAKQNREALDEAMPNGDGVFFSRSAAPGQQAYTSVFWSGDSNTDFERWDGLPSNLPALLSSALSGIAIWTVDVGGYMSLFTPARDEETLARWTELAALLPVMRTHHGTHPRRSVQFFSNARTLAHYGTYARLHTALFPMFRQLVDEAMREGTPVCRPLLMEYPGDDAAWGVEDQFLVGSDLLVAPVIARSARSRDVYLPAGERWVDLWSGRVHAGGRSIAVDAPLGTLPLFLRDGGFLVLFDRHVDTLVRRSDVSDASVRTLDDAEESLAFVLTPSFVGVARTYDGTTLELLSRSSSSRAPALAHAEARGLETLPASLTKTWRRVARGQGQCGGLAVDAGSLRGSWIEVTGKRSRTITAYSVGTT